RAVDVVTANDGFEVRLDDGRRLWVPYSWFPRLESATPAQRAHWEIIGSGVGIHWPDIDEDLSVAGLLRGIRAPDSSDLAGR
ncbi:MAG TPA: DUF2442 domain-containing protein, partial [Longimicrobiales bacterium]